MVDEMNFLKILEVEIYIIFLFQEVKAMTFQGSLV